MIRNVTQNLGAFFIPQMALSVLTLWLIAGYLAAWFRRELQPGATPWTRSLDPLASVASCTGLLGSVTGFIQAFGGFQNGINVAALTRGLAVAYYTTGVGIFTSLVAMLGCWGLTLLNREER